ncbi:hypothetical protein I4U23_028069 [Adineta vaga]|nr:hypothetical protein I4U23_028069 [Adineta vaga]
MDIAFLLVDKSTTNLFNPTVTHLISSIINPLIEEDYNTHLALLNFKYENDSLIQRIYPFTNSIITFKEYLSAHQTSMEHGDVQNEAIAICKESFLLSTKTSHMNHLGDILRAALRLQWRTTQSECCHENIVFLITDNVPCRYLINSSNTHDNDDPCACDDLREISNAFVSKNLTLIIIGVGQLVTICDHLYSYIARNTGGEYIPLTNAAHVLQMVLQSVIRQGDTLLQSLRHIKQEEFEKNSTYRFSKTSKQNQSEVKHCQVMAQKGVWLLNPFHQASYV